MWLSNALGIGALVGVVATLYLFLWPDKVDDEVVDEDECE